MLRRLLFAVAIVFMAKTPQLAVIFVMGLSVCALAFTLIEKPWKDPLI